MSRLHWEFEGVRRRSAFISASAALRLGYFDGPIEKEQTVEQRRGDVHQWARPSALDAKGNLTKQVLSDDRWRGRLFVILHFVRAGLMSQ